MKYWTATSVDFSVHEPQLKVRWQTSGDRREETQSIIFPDHFKCESKQGKYIGASNYLTAANCCNLIFFHI